MNTYICKSRINTISEVAFYSSEMNLNVNVVRQAGRQASIMPKLFAALVWNEVCCVAGGACCSCGCEITVSVHNNFFNDVIIITHVYKSITISAEAATAAIVVVFICHSCTHKLSKHREHLIFKWHVNGNTCDEIHF